MVKTGALARTKIAPNRIPKNIVTTDFTVARVLSRETNRARTGPWKPKGIRNAMLIIMMSVAANTMRATVCVRCG